MPHRDNVPALRGLTCLAGAAAAIVRSDHEGAELLIKDMIAGQQLPELLVTISLATLTQLDSAVSADGGAARAHGSRNLALELMEIADRYAMSDPNSIRSAAWRLDAVRRRDHRTARSEVRTSLANGTIVDLVCGATALFAATVEVAGRAAGTTAERSIADFCLAASLAEAS